MESKFFSTKQIFDQVTLIGGRGGEQCYLVEGTERALLIDGLTGAGSLKAFVRELTDLPVTLVITHGHLDHAGAAYEYGECFIHPDDIALMYSEQHSGQEARLGFVTAGREDTGVTLSDILPAVPVKTYPVYDGDVFDLGGVEIEAIQVPGHTCGTIVLLDRSHRTVYSGDACNLNTLLGLPGSASIEEYKESLLHLKEYQKEFDVMWGGHGPMSVPNTAVDDGIRLCEAILSRTDDKVPTQIFGENCMLAKRRDGNFLPEGGGFCNIVYSEEKLHRKPGKKIKGVPNPER